MANPASTAACTAYLWTFSPDTDGADAFATYTGEYGDANHAESCISFWASTKA